MCLWVEEPSTALASSPCHLSPAPGPSRTLQDWGRSELCISAQGRRDRAGGQRRACLAVPPCCGSEQEWRRRPSSLSSPAGWSSGHEFRAGLMTSPGLPSLSLRWPRHPGLLHKPSYPHPWPWMPPRAADRVPQRLRQPEGCLTAPRGSRGPAAPPGSPHQLLPGASALQQGHRQPQLQTRKPRLRQAQCPACATGWRAPSSVPLLFPFALTVWESRSGHQDLLVFKPWKPTQPSQAQGTASGKSGALSPGWDLASTSSCVASVSRVPQPL